MTASAIKRMSDIKPELLTVQETSKYSDRFNTKVLSYSKPINPKPPNIKQGHYVILI